MECKEIQSIHLLLHSFIFIFYLYNTKHPHIFTYFSWLNLFLECCGRVVFKLLLTDNSLILLFGLLHLLGQGQDNLQPLLLYTLSLCDLMKLSYTKLQPR